MNALNAVRVLSFLAVAAVCESLPHATLAQSIDPLEGRIVREIRVTGLRNLSPDVVERHLATHVGEPFRRATLDVDRRRLDELRLFSAVSVEARIENDGVILVVALTETLRFLPTVIVRVTDENGLSAGAGIRGINMLGDGRLVELAVRGGGETSVVVGVDRPTITPGTWAQHFEFSYSQRFNPLYDFDEEATSINARVARNWRHSLSSGVAAEFLTIDTGSSGASLSADGRDVIPRVGGFVTVDTLDSSSNPQSGTWAELQIDRLFGDADSWSFILDGRRFQPLWDRHGLGLFSLATFQTGVPDIQLPEYLQFALGGANSVRGWSLGSRRGRNQFLGTLEYTYVLYPVQSFTVAGLNLYAGLQLVGFGDAGMTSNDTAATATSAIGGYGLGLKVLVPFVDVIRLEIGWGEPGRGASAYFGVSLKAIRQRERVR